MTRPPVKNPWGLTWSEVDVLDTICQLGNQADTAKRLRISDRTVRTHLQNAGRKLGVSHSHLRAAVLFDRWRQTDGRGVAA